MKKLYHVSGAMKDYKEGESIEPGWTKLEVQQQFRPTDLRKGYHDVVEQYSKDRLLYNVTHLGADRKIRPRLWRK